MGILDDAIREHLDLKRRRGADPLEVERDEREALGPVRRAPEAPDVPPSDDDDEPEGDRPASSLAYDQERDEESWTHDDPFDDEPEAGDLEDDDSEPDDEQFGSDVPEFEPPAGTVSDTEHEPAPRSHRSGDETIEYEVEDALESEDHDAEPRSKDDDVLEETPEFLQDTPDHDRLWFEQRPPKDFDFDG